MTLIRVLKQLLTTTADDPLFGRIVLENYRALHDAIESATG
jgi:hypothetical protein